MPVGTKIQVRRDTAANWTSTNPTLAAGEIGFETDTRKLKVGNGSTAWTSLAYTVDSSGGGATTLDGLTDVVITSATNGQVLKFDGTNWINNTDSLGFVAQTSAPSDTNVLWLDTDEGAAGISGDDDQIILPMQVFS